jgi:signal peptidase I
MVPTLEKGDVILNSKLAYNIFGIDYNDPEPGDIITFEHDNELLIKRVKDTNSRGELFVVGDNKDNSLDSRDFGYVSKEDLVGKAIIKVNFKTFSFVFLE